MNWEKSCGSIVYTRRDGEIRFVIVQELAGAYSFPKGHIEGDETEMETARREVFEEIGLVPTFIEGFRGEDEYDLLEKPGTRKKVVYFLTELGDEPLAPRPGEIKRISLLTCEEAMQCFEHESTRKVLCEAYQFILRR